VAWRRRVGAPEVNQQRPCFETWRDARASIRGGRDPRESRTMLRERRVGRGRRKARAACVARFGECPRRRAPPLTRLKRPRENAESESNDSVHVAAEPRARSTRSPRSLIGPTRTELTRSSRPREDTRVFLGATEKTKTPNDAKT
jgi:hypothetical protein